MRARVLLAISLTLLVLSCDDRETAMPPDDSTTTPIADAPGAGGRPLMAPEPTPGVSFRLSEADPSAPDAPERPPATEGEPLDDARLQELLQRLPPLPESAAAQRETRLREGPPPPAVAGQDIPMAFPAPDEAPPVPEANQDGPRVLRVQPEGDVPVARHVAVTFSQPMVPLASVSQVDAMDVPVTLEPRPEGRWRWVGSRTLLFEGRPRLPMATAFEASVEAGVETADGQPLPEGRTWTFRTPPPSLVDRHPTAGPVERSPVIVLVFDQRIDPAAVADTVTASADGVDLTLRLASDQELDGDDAARAVVERATDGRWLALVPEAQLPLGAEVDITVGPETPSAEGPLTTEDEQRFSFQVYDALRIEEVTCAGDEGPIPFELLGRGERATDCRPLGPWLVRFNNPLRPETVDQEAVRVSPELPSMRVETESDRLVIRGLSAGRTEYTVFLPAEIGDIFGQQLDEAVELSFETDAAPALFAPGGDMVVADPFAPPQLTLSVINHDELDVALYRVTPDDWRAFRDFANGLGAREAAQEPPGEQVSAERVRTEGQRDAITRVPVDLTPALTEGRGHVVVVARVPGWSPEDDDAWRNRPVARWVQVTDMAVDAFADGQRVLSWVTALEDGTPVTGAQVRYVGASAAAATTDDAGLAELATVADPENEARGDEVLVVAEQGRDVAFVIADPWLLQRQPGRQELRWHVFNDRGLYRPGEEAAVRGYLRSYGTGVGGDLEPLGDDVAAVAWTLRATNGEEVASGEWPVDQVGGFGGRFTVPASIQVGPASLDLRALGVEDSAGGRSGLGLMVAEFRRPEFEVTVRAERPEIVLGQRGVVEAEASYFAGGALPGADVEWHVTGSPTDYSPPGWPDFQFGRWTPWWGHGEIEPGGPLTHESWSGRTDAAGVHRLGIEPSGVHPLSAARFTAEATVLDVNRQAITGRTSLLAHPAEHYVGMQADGWFSGAGEPWSVALIVVDANGEVVPGSVVELRAERLEGRWVAGTWRDEAEAAGACSEVSAAEPVRCEFTFTEGGRYQITAAILDDEGRPNESQLNVWVPGGPARPQDRSVERQEVELIPDADRYAPGETARVLLRAPFAPADALITQRRSGLESVERLRLSEPTRILEIPITDGHVPNLEVSVELVGAAPRTTEELEGAEDTAPRPAFASGSVTLPVPPVRRELNVALAAPSSVRPGAEVSMTLTVRDADGEPLPEAGVTLLVVDEAVLSLTDHRVQSPLEAFYSTRPGGVNSRHGREAVVLATMDELLSAEAGMADEMLRSAQRGGDVRMQSMSMDYAMDEMADAEAPAALMATNGRGGGLEQSAPAVPERVDLNPLAAFEPGLVTDPTGTITTTVSLPDNVTRYRITAVATDGGQRFGLGESPMLAELPLVVRPSAPRFLNFGDTFELPLVVQSRAAEDRVVDVLLRARNLAVGDEVGQDLAGLVAEQAGSTTAEVSDDASATTETPSGDDADVTEADDVAPDEAPAPAAGVMGVRVTVPAGDRVEVRFPAAALLPGTAAFQAAAFDVDDVGAADAQRVTLPVWTPATSEAFATYGTLDEGATAQQVRRPADAVPGFGGLEITTSSTALSELSDAFLYLNEQPFEGVEQIASRLLANVALRDVVAALAGDGPSSAEVDAAINADIERLQGLQRPDGGWAWWGPFEQSSPWPTLHATHALTLGERRGADVDDPSLERALERVRNIEALIDEQRWPWPPAARWAAQAYALRVRATADDVAPQAAAELLDEAGDEASVEILGWLLNVLARSAEHQEAAEEIARRINNRVVEEAGTAQIAAGYEEEAGALVAAGDRRAEAVVLEALVRWNPESDLLPKLVRGLLEGRQRGRWASTQENAFVLLAMDAYYRALEAVEPDFVARVWLGDRFAGQAAFEGRDADRRQLDLPLSALPDAQQDTALVLAKDGPGRLYYRLGLRYAPADLSLEPAERGFSVARRYEAIDDPEDVRRTADGSWEVRAGARVRVRLTMVAPERRYHVALVDPLPAGLEALNPALATTESVPPPELEPEEDEAARESMLAQEGRQASSLAPRTWWGSWYDHEGFRDDRVEVLAQQVAGGVWSYDYVARATTPGTFVVPPIKEVEELYHPETFARGATERMRVLAP